MANDLATRAAVQVMAETFFENYPLSRIATKGINRNGDQIAPMYRGKTYTIDRPNVNQFTATATTAATAQAANQDVIQLPTTITVDQDYNVKWAPTDLELAQASWTGKIPQTWAAARDTLAANVEAALVAKAKIGGFRQITKTSDAFYDLAALDEKLKLNGVFSGKRLLAVPTILHFTSNANLQSSLIGAGQDTGTGFASKLGTIEFCHQMVGGTWTKGTGSAYVADGAHAKGKRAITIKTGSNTVLAGDIVTFAGDTQEYVVETGVTAAGTIYIYPGLKVALDDGDAMTISSTDEASYGRLVHESALALAFGEEFMPPEEAAKLLAFESVTTENGITLVYERKREYGQTSSMLRVIYGAGDVYHDGIIRYKIS